MPPKFLPVSRARLQLELPFGRVADPLLFGHEEGVFRLALEWRNEPSMMPMMLAFRARMMLMMLAVPAPPGINDAHSPP